MRVGDKMMRRQPRGSHVRVARSLLVLGGGSDIALATAHRLVTAGYRKVVLAGRDPRSLQPVVERLRAAGGEDVFPIAFDALDTASHRSVIDECFERSEGIDTALVAFGVLGDQKEFDSNPEAAALTARTNYVGAVSACLGVAARLREQGHGTIVVISGATGERVRKANFVYGSTKAGLDAFAQGLGDSLAGTGVRVLIVRPGFVIGTKMTTGMPVGPMATTVDRVADAIVAGLGSRREILWVPASLRWVMAVLRHLPRPLWRRITAHR